MQLNFISGKILSDVECCICYSTKCSKSGYEKLVKCTTEKAALSLQQCATQKNDNPRLLASVAGLEVQNIVAYELHYHRTCQKEYTRPNKSLGGNVKLDDAALKELYGVVTETVIEQGKVMFTEEFRSIYETHCQDKNANAVPNRVRIKRIAIAKCDPFFNYRDANVVNSTKFAIPNFGRNISFLLFFFFVVTFGVLSRHFLRITHSRNTIISYFQ